ncbi:unnamed protein product [Dimorphilus gyrociliatus]|uniref:Uncharacterized protein n=1 Tax=Dimorphilus gyrociliatus TaxID=2664684 RepID=A0A7I8VNQ7_9ANNE|nr:unnamed protein product [Dimorphilus gyrociliatus]
MLYESVSTVDTNLQLKCSRDNTSNLSNDNRSEEVSNKKSVGGELEWEECIKLRYTERPSNILCNSPPPANGTESGEAEVDSNANRNSTKTIVDNYDIEMEKLNDDSQNSMLHLTIAPTPRLGYYADIMMERKGIKGKHSKFDERRTNTLQLPEVSQPIVQRRHSSASNSSVGDKDNLLELITNCREMEELNLNFEKKLFVKKDYFLSTAFGLLLGILTALFARSLVLVLFG